MTLRFPIAAAAIALLAGCAVSPEQALAGNYIVDVNRVEIPQLPAGLGGAGGDTLKKAMGTMNLKLRADKTFLLAGGIGAAGGNTEGTWSLGEEGVTMIPKGPKKHKEAPDKFVLTQNAGNKELTLAIPTMVGEIKVILVKNGT
ncbi:hypothetical protein EON79_06020 [bacterium]|nr:MAG: hypothetical protein EON79_06020 [bacterium]